MAIMRWILGALFAAIALGACHPGGNVIVVDTVVDTVDVAPGDGLCADSGGACSLRAAVQEGNALPGVDVIQLGNGLTYVLTRAGTGEDASATGDLDLTDGFDLVGNGATIDANGLDRVIDVHVGLTDLIGVTITGGAATDGAGLRVATGATLRLDQTTVTGNTAAAGSPIASEGSLWAFGATVHDNQGTTSGGIEVDGGMANLTNVTLSGNQATAGAGGLRMTAGDLTIRTMTVTDNAGTTAGGIHVTGGTARIVGSAVGEQRAGDDCVGPLSSLGYNVESATSCGFGATGDLQNQLLGLAVLGDGGGGLPVHMPTPLSVLLDSMPGGACAWPLDARNFGRNDGACDSGAVERLTAANLVVTHGGDDVDATPGDGVCQDASGAPGDCSLRAAIDESNAFAAPVGQAEEINFAAGVSTVTLSIVGDGEDANATGDLDVLGDVVIVGAGTVIDADGIERSIHVGNGAVLDLFVVTLTGGVGGGGHAGGLGIDAGATATLYFAQVDDNDGSGISVGGTLSLFDSHVTENRYVGEGGGVRDIGGGTPVVVIDRSAILANESGDDGGGLAFNFAADLTLSNSTVAGNTAVAHAGGVNLDNFTAAVINNTTIVGNSAGDTGGLTAEVRAGGLVFIRNSVVALNTAPQRANCNPGAGFLTSQGHNFFGPECLGPGDLAVGDIQGTDPMLAPLALYGGVVNHRPPVTGSPLIGAGDPGVPGTGGTACATFDTVRVRRTDCSIGAAEGP